MIEVRVVGWIERRVADPVALVKLVRRHAGMEQKEAFELLKVLSATGEVTVALRDRATADAFVEDVEALGERTAARQRPRPGQRSPILPLRCEIRTP
jgi:hypothetical protein